MKTRKVRRLAIEEDRYTGYWRIRLYFDKGRCKVLCQTYDTHNSACLAASGISIIHNWFPLEAA